MLWMGALLALGFNALYFLRCVKVLGHVFDFAFIVFCGFAYVWAVNFCDYGKIGVMTAAIMLLGFFLMNKLGGKIVKAGLQLLYNRLFKWYNWSTGKIFLRYIKNFKNNQIKQKAKDERFSLRYFKKHKRRQA
ncbi:MAG: hypothetical protein LBN07_00150 [Christensenellaceae bacterium]|nr:hypothetical protein [Christensenellaceae bacterium]